MSSLTSNFIPIPKMPADIMEICRICLQEEQANVNIFDVDDVRKLCLKIAVCLPIKISADDRLPKRICETCVNKVCSFYEFWNIAKSSQKQLDHWLDLADAEKIEDTPSNYQFAGFWDEKNEKDKMELSNFAGNVKIEDEVSEREDYSFNVGELNIKEEKEDDIYIIDDEAQTEELEPITFVSVSFPDDEAGPSRFATVSNNPVISQSARFQDNVESGNVGNSWSVKEEINGDSSTLSCNICGEVCSLTDFNNHRLKHKNKNLFSCSICGKNFRNLEILEKHQVEHENDKNHTCTYCEKHFRTANLRDQHEKKFHSFKDEIIFSCTHSGCTFSSNSATNLKFHVQRHYKEFNFKCDVCGKGYYDKKSLEAHSYIHAGTKTFTCDCGKSYLNESDLRDHQKSHFPVSEPFKEYSCLMCNAVFPTFLRLKQHRLTHSRLESLSCFVCGKAVSSATSLRNHLRSHTGEKPYACKFCGKCFRNKKTLKTHTDSHEGRRWKCESCEKSFTQQSTLIIHRRIHTGERPYECPFCDFKFMSKPQLVAHLRKHSVFT